MRLHTVGCLAVLALVGCGVSRHRLTNAAPARAALDAYVVEFWTKRDSAALGRALSPVLAYHYNGRVVPGVPAAHHSALREWGAIFPDLSATVDAYTFSGDLGAAVTTWSGTHTQPMCKTPGSGKKVQWAVNYIFRVKDGRIVELWEAWDEGGFYRRLGVDPAKCG
jgi:predicted ester cyclase